MPVLQNNQTQEIKAYLLCFGRKMNLEPPSDVYQILIRGHVRLVQVDNKPILSQGPEDYLNGPLYPLATPSHNTVIIQVDTDLDPLQLLPEVFNDKCQDLGEDPWCCGQTKWKFFELIQPSLPMEPQVLAMAYDVWVHESMHP